MSLLSSLLEFSNNQPTSLMFCESPKEINLDRNTKELRNLMSARKEQIATPEKRPASKSLTKLDLLSFSNTKIDPKERLLHRMVHKVNMKVRKHYYNFFVVLENLKKNNVSLFSPKKDKQENIKISSGFVKVMQLSQILFSKYFVNSLKKSAFQALSSWSKAKNAISKLKKIVDKKILCEGFRNMLKYSKKIEKEIIRLQILMDSIHHIDRSTANYHKVAYMETFMGKLKANLSNIRTAAKPKEPQQLKTPSKPTAEPQIVTIKPFSGAYSPFSKEKTSNLVNSIQQSYQNLKNRKRKSDESPGKPKQPIMLACQQVKLKIEKCFNYIKNSKCKINLNQQTLPVKFSKQTQYQISRRCQPILLNSHEVPDLSDRGTIFFHQLFSSIQMNQNCAIAQSSVKLFGKKDSISETFSDQLHSTSQVTLIAPLSQKYYESPRKSISSSGVKGSAFGYEAVNFKNSLVVERELMKDHDVEEKSRDKKQFNFAKIKNQVKNQKRAHDEYFQAESRYKVDNRCQSAERDYNSLKYRREGDFSISIPQGTITQSANTTSRQAPFIKRSSDTPEPDSLRGNYTSERKHLSLMNNNKVQLLQQENKKSVGGTYLTILSKR